MKMIYPVTIVLLGAALPGSAAELPGQKPVLALFGFDLVSSSPEPVPSAEKARLHMAGEELARLLRESGNYTVIDLVSETETIERGAMMINCNGCELVPAQQAGASLVAYGWVQKVSNLILNMNVVIKDAKTGSQLAFAGADIRGNTDQSWRRGIKFIAERLPSTSSDSGLTGR